MWTGAWTTPSYRKGVFLCITVLGSTRLAGGFLFRSLPLPQLPEGLKKKRTASEKAARTAVLNTRKTIMPDKNTASSIMLAKKTNIVLFSDKAIKKPKLFLPDAVERPQGLSGSNSTLSALSRSYQVMLLPTSAPLPNALKYDSPLFRRHPIAAPRATVCHKKRFAAAAL